MAQQWNQWLRSLPVGRRQSLPGRVATQFPARTGIHHLPRRTQVRRTVCLRQKARRRHRNLAQRQNVPGGVPKWQVPRERNPIQSRWDNSPGSVARRQVGEHWEDWEDVVESKQRPDQLDLIGKIAKPNVELKRNREAGILAAGERQCN